MSIKVKYMDMEGCQCMICGREGREGCQCM